MLDKNKEMINHPSHYKGSKFEVIDIIEDFQLDFCMGNAIKYILRCEKKENQAQDLKKAIWYLNRKINQIEENTDEKQRLLGNQSI